MAVKTFTTGEVLTAADTNTYLANSGLVYVKSQTIGSAVSSVTVSNAFSSDFEMHKIIITGGAASTYGLIRFAFASVTTGYYAGAVGANNLGVVAGVGDNNAARWSYAGWADGNAINLNCDVSNAAQAKRKYISAYNVLHSGSTYSVMSGDLVDTTARTDLVLTPSTGTWTGGTITVYGYRKA